MDRRRFLFWSLVGAILWVVSITLLGFLLGRKVPALGENIDLVIILILVFSVIPVAFEWWRHRRHSSSRSEDRDGVPDLGVLRRDTPRDS